LAFELPVSAYRNKASSPRNWRIDTILLLASDR